MSGPSFFQTIGGRAFYEGTMPKLANAAERIATSLEKLSAQGRNRDPKHDRLTVAGMARDLFLANEDPADNPEYLRGQVEMLCSTAELMATKVLDADGLGDQRDQVIGFVVEHRVMLDEYGAADGLEHFVAWVTSFYFKEED